MRAERARGEKAARRGPPAREPLARAWSASASWGLVEAERDQSRESERGPRRPPPGAVQGLGACIPTQSKQFGASEGQIKPHILPAPHTGSSQRLPPLGDPAASSR